MPKYVTLEWEEWKEIQDKADQLDAMNSDGVHRLDNGTRILRITKHWTLPEGMTSLKPGDEKLYSAVAFVGEDGLPFAIFEKTN